MSSRSRGLLFIVSAPSGAGKTTLVERLIEQTPHLKMSRSYTSRRARQEVAAFVEYDFVVINDEITTAVERLRSIVVAERSRLRWMRGEAETIVRTFG